MQKYDKLKSITVLYVEDSKFLAKTTLKSIEKYFHKIYLAYNGQDALELLKEHKSDIDIIITDLVMPVLDGIEMLGRIRKDGCNIPVIITTGFESALALEKIIELSIEGFIAKPLDINKLLEKTDGVATSLFIKRELAAKKEMIDNDIIYSETDENGIITYISKPFEKICGYSKNELVGKSHSLLKHPDTSPSLYKEMWSTLQSFRQWQGEMTNRKKDGSSYSLNSIISPMYLRERLIGYSATCIDITELQAKSLELQAKSRLAAMGEMISMIAHQWRQPISSIGMISNNIELDLIMDELDKNKLGDRLHSINQQVSYLSNTITIFSNFLDKSKQKKEFSMTASVVEAIDEIKEQYLDKNINISISNQRIDFKINTFKDELIQTVINVMTNAKEAIVDKNIPDGKIDILFEEDASSVYIKISNNAGNLQKDIFDKIFTPYFTTKNNKNGAGLGLYISKTIVETTLDGVISVQNIENGVEFTIKLPK